MKRVKNVSLIALLGAVAFSAGGCGSDEVTSSSGSGSDNEGGTGNASGTGGMGTGADGSGAMASTGTSGMGGMGGMGGGGAGGMGGAGGSVGLASPCDILPEVCDGKDNDCDGQVDEELTTACETACGMGTMTCVAGTWSVCDAPKPAVEVCDGKDNDCNGQVDDGIYPACAPGCMNGAGTTPTVAIGSSLVEASVITKPVTIDGTVADADVDSWVLEWAPEGSNEFTPIATGTSAVNNGTLGVLDPTLIENGLITVRLRAADCDNFEVIDQRSVIIEGDNKVGEMRVAFQDLVVNVGGFPIEVLRSYDSKRRRQPGDFGHGWELDISASGKLTRNAVVGEKWAFSCPIFGTKTATELAPHVLEVRLGPREFYRFKPVVTGIYATQGTCWGYLGFQHIGGRPGTLGLQPGKSTLVFQQSQFDYMVFDDNLQTVDVNDAVLTTYDGRVIELSRVGGVKSLGDTFGNKVTIGPNGATHNSGVSIQVNRQAGRVASITDPAGKTISYMYSPSGDLIGVTDRDGHETKFSYLYDHLLDRIDDPSGRTPLRVEYDSTGRMKQWADANQNPGIVAFDPMMGQASVTRDGNTTSLGYDQAGRVAQISGPEGKDVQFGYDANGNLTQITHAPGITEQQTYDAQGNLTSKTDQAGNVTTYTNTYGPNGQLTKTVMVDPAGATTTTEYGPGNKVTRVVSPSGLETTYQYDAKGNLTTQVIKNGVETATTQFTYDANGRPTKVVDALGRTTDKQYDANGRETSVITYRTVNGALVPIETQIAYDASGHRTLVTLPSGAQRKMTYDPSGRLTALQREDGQTIQYQFDPAGRRTMEIEPAVPGYPQGVVTAQAYDGQGRVTSAVSPTGIAVAFARDKLGRPTEAIFGDGSSVASQYDALGRLQQQVDERGEVVTVQTDPRGLVSGYTSGGRSAQYQYDQRGQITSWTDEDGIQQSYTYDAAGRLINFVRGGMVSTYAYDAAGRLTARTVAGYTTTYAYDLAGRLTQVTDPKGAVTKFAYDEADNLISMTDANNHLTTYAYDIMGRRTKETLPTGVSATMEYDVGGHLIKRTDFDGKVTTYAYDALGRMTQKTLPDGQTIQMDYDGLGNVTRVVDARGETRYVWGLRSELRKATYPDGNWVQYEYDASGDLIAKETLAGKTRYEYGAFGNVTKIIDPDGGQTTYVYTASGPMRKPSSATLPNGATVEWTYDPLGRTQKVAHFAQNGMPIASFTYGYDNHDRQVSVTEVTPAGTTSIEYTYDVAGRLVAEKRTPPSGGLVTFTYAYDAVGNRISMTGPGGSTSYSYDAADRLLSAGPTAFTYDAAGHLIKANGPMGNVDYAYNGAGFLASVKGPGLDAAFGYDGEGRRISQTVNGTETRYVLDVGARLPQVLEERDAAGNLLRSYIHGYGLARQKEGNDLRYPHIDAQRSVRLLSDGAGAVTDERAYDAFGNVAATSGNTVMAFGWKGEQTDASTGLQYLRARYYDFATGRFVSRDDFPYVATDPRTYHRYSFGDGEPVNRFDPTGQFWGGVYTGLISAGQLLGSLSVLWVGIMGIWQWNRANSDKQYLADYNANFGKYLESGQLGFPAGLREGKKRDLYRLQDLNSNVILPRLMFFGIGRVGLLGNMSGDWRRKCRCIATKTGKMILEQSVAYEINNASKYTVNVHASAPDGWHSWTVLSGYGYASDGGPDDKDSMAVHIDNWYNGAPPIAAYSQLGDNGPGNFDPDDEGISAACRHDWKWPSQGN